ncbi:MAG: arginase family protein [bacterium]|nr:arginase family protein [bacterium]
MQPWEIVSLEMDYPGEIVGKFFVDNFGKLVRRELQHKQKDYKCRSKKYITRLIHSALGSNDKKKLVVYGSGYYHHYTYGLCRSIDRQHNNYGYIHFDHHTDYDCEREELKPSEIYCGTFVKDLLHDTNASSIFLVGSNTVGLNLLPGIQHQYILESGLRTGSKFNKFRKRLAKMPEKVYLSFDLDVLAKSAIIASHDQGTLRPHELMRALAIIKETKEIIGADILGFSRCHSQQELNKMRQLLKKNNKNPQFPSTLFSGLYNASLGLDIYKKIAELIIDN